MRSAQRTPCRHHTTSQQGGMGQGRNLLCSRDSDYLVSPCVTKKIAFLTMSLRHMCSFHHGVILGPHIGGRRIRTRSARNVVPCARRRLILRGSAYYAAFRFRAIGSNRRGRGMLAVTSMLSVGSADHSKRIRQAVPVQGRNMALTVAIPQYVR